MDRQGIFDYIRKKYEVLPEYPWRRYDDNAVFRHADNKKWFALLMSVQRNRMGLSGAEYADVINLKMDDIFFRDQIKHSLKYFPLFYCKFFINVQSSILGLSFFLSKKQT